MFTSFALNPKVDHFLSQQVGEKVFLLLRRHWVTNVNWLLIGVVLVILPIAVAAFPEFFPFWPQISSSAKFIALAIWYLLAAIYLFENFLGWYYNVFVITDQRILDIDFFGLFYTSSSEARFEEIQDVTHTQGGILQIIFNYGNVSVQTAGTQENIEIDGVTNPTKVHQLIIDLKESQGNHSLGA